MNLSVSLQCRWVPGGFWIVLGMVVVTGPLAAQTDLTGQWRIRFDVTRANGECFGEAGEFATDIANIDHNVETGAVTLTWIEEFTENTAYGTLSGNTFSYSMLFQQDGGWTDRNVTLTIDDDDHMTGTEAWTWGYTPEDRSTCSDSASDVEAWRLPKEEEQVLLPKMRSFGMELDFLMRATPDGRRLLALYEEHRGELLSIYLTNPSIGGSAILTASEFDEALKKPNGPAEENDERGALIETYDAVRGSLGAVLADSESGPAIDLIDQNMVDRIANLANLISEEASAGLANDIQAESDRLSGFQDLVGMGVEQLAQTLGVDLESVTMKVFDSSLEEDGFRIEVGQVEGLDFELWKSKTLAAESWSQVKEPGMQVEAGRMILTDPDPGEGKCFYRVLRVQPD